MDESLEELQSALLGIYKNVLMHEHFFETVASAYEVAVFRPLSTFPLFPQPAEIVFRKQKSKIKPSTEKPPETDPDNLRVPRAFGLVINDPLLSRIKSSQPDFHHIVADFKSRIHSTKIESQAAKNRFLASLQVRTHPSPSQHSWDKPAANAFSCYALLDQMLKLLGSTEFMKPVLAACIGDDQSYYTLEEAALALQSLVFFTWLGEELPKIQAKLATDELSPIVEGVKRTITSSGAVGFQPLFDDFKGESRLLARIKTCKSLSQFSDLQSEYSRFSRWHAQAEVLKYIKTRFSSDPPSVPVLRALLSIVHSDGKRIATVLRETK